MKNLLDSTVCINKIHLLQSRIFVVFNLFESQTKSFNILTSLNKLLVLATEEGRKKRRPNQKTPRQRFTEEQRKDLNICYKDSKYPSSKVCREQAVKYGTDEYSIKVSLKGHIMQFKMILY